MNQVRHVLFNSTSLIRRLVFALTTRCLCEVGTELPVRWVGWTCHHYRRRKVERMADGTLSDG